MKKFLSILAASLILLSCSDDDNTNTSGSQIALDTQTIAFDVDGSAPAGNSVTIACDGDWRMIGSQNWFVPSATSGKSGSTITFAATSNASEDELETVFTFICGSKSAQLKVVQGPEAVIEYLNATTTFTVAKAGGYITTPIRSNVEIEWEASEDWITADPRTRSATEEWHQFYVKPNSDTPYAGRTATITLFKGTPKERVYTVNQTKQNGIILDMITDTVGMSANASVTFSIEANVTYTVANLSTAWLTCTEITAAREPKNAGMTVKTYQLTCITEAPATRVGTVNFAGSAGTGVSGQFKLVQENPNKIIFTMPDPNLRTYCKGLNYISVVNETTGECQLLYDGIIVTSLNLSSRSLTSLTGISKFSALTLLTLSYNSTITTGWEEIKLLPLTTFTMIGGGLTSLEFLEGLNTLTTLTASSNLLTSLDGIQNMTGLKSLTVSSNNLTSASEITGLTGLTSLSIGSNNITSVDVSNSPNLTSLTLSYMPLSELILGDVNIAAISLTSMYYALGSPVVYQIPTSFTITGTKVKTLSMRASSAVYDNMQWIDVSGCPALITIDCRRTALKCTELWLATGQTITNVTKDAITTIKYRP